MFNTKPLFTALLSSLCFISSSQNITNSGTDFWLSFMEFKDLTTAVYQVNITSNTATTGFVEIPGTGFFQNFSVVPNIVSKVTIPSNDATITGSEIVMKRAIHIVTNDDVVVYSNSYHQYRSEASLVLPTPALGNEYRAMTYETQQHSLLDESEFIVVAAGDSVTVEITPTGNTAGGHLANVPFTVTLDTGDVYQVQAQTVNDDLTGSLIRSLDPNQKFALYSGNVWISSFCVGNADPIYEVAYPVNTWGQEYVLLLTSARYVMEYRVMASQDNTQIFKNGNLIGTLNAGQWIQDTVSAVSYITGDKPIAVGTFEITGNCPCLCYVNTNNAWNGDPSLIMLNPNEQMYLDTVTFYTIKEVQIDSNWVHIVTRTPDTALTQYNFTPVTNWNVFQYDTNYSYVTLKIDTGSHTITTTGCGFLAYVIGYGSAESYAYAAGVRLNDLHDSLGFTNISTGNNNTICVTDTIQFFSSTSNNPLNFLWYFGDGDSSTAQYPYHSYADSGSYPIQLIVEYACRYDTVFDTLNVILKPVVDLGVDTFICDPYGTMVLYADNPNMNYTWLPGGETSDSIVVSQSGTYTVVVSNGVCEDSSSIDITIATEPVSSASADPITICEGETVNYTADSDTLPNVWNWNFGDGNTSNEQSPQHDFPSEGTYNYSLIIDYDCHKDTFNGTIVVLKQPFVDLGPDTILCLPGSYELDAGNTGMVYEWSTGDNEEKFTVTETGTYSVKVNNSFCISEDEVYVDIPLEGSIPNVFTPNGDGLNDEFRIGVHDRCDVYNLKIFNRWGKLVFETDDPLNEFWDGNISGRQKAKEGTYYFILSSSYDPVTGHVTLLR